MIEESITLKIRDYTITFNKSSKKATFKESNTEIPSPLFAEELKTGIFFCDLNSFNGYMFYQNNKNFYDTNKKIIYFANKNIFIGDADKEAFSLFENFEEKEKNLKNGIKEKKNEFSDEERKKIDDEIFNGIKKELEKFDGKIKLKNGKYGKLEKNEDDKGKNDIKFNNDTYDYIHGNKLERFIDNKKFYEGDFIQEEEDNSIYILKHGKGKDFEFDNIYEGEFFYNFRIGRGKMRNENNEKFYFFKNGFEQYLFEISKKDGIILYGINDKRILLEMKEKDLTKPVRILVKDINNENIRYEINAKMTNNYKLKGSGIVRDFINHEILIVNFDTKNIITNDLDNLEIFIDKDEFIMNKKTKEEILAKDVIRRIIDDILKYENNIEYLANKINEKMIEEKIEILGIRDQGGDPECWVYALSELIYMTNSRIYGRKVTTFKQIYEDIIKKYSKLGKTDEDIEKIMNQELPKYNFKYSKMEDDNEIKSYLKNGIQCLLTFDLNNKQWENFCDYFKVNSTNQEIKIFTKEISEKPVKKKLDKPDELEGHAVVLIDIDENDNYIIVNSWGEHWGDSGKFRVKKDSLQNVSIYALYYITDELKNEDKENWFKFKKSIKEDLNEIKVGKVLKNFRFRCPVCQKSEKITNYYALTYYSLKCPFADECIFNADNYYFIADQILLYEKNKYKNKKNKFDLEYQKELYKYHE